MERSELSMLIQRCLLYSAEFESRIDYELGVSRYVGSAKGELNRSELPAVMKAVLGIFLGQAFKQIDTPQDASRRIDELLGIINIGNWEAFGASSDDLGGTPSVEFRDKLFQMLENHAKAYIVQIKKEMP